MALIAVLWLIALLTLLATALVSLSVTRRRSAERYVESVQADSTADSAIRVVLLRLIAPPDQHTSWPIGQAQSLAILDTNVSVTVQREAGRIDLNAADRDLLEALFAANGWREGDARSMAARLVDWRDADDVAGDGGAESSEYRSAHLPYGPRNAPFESVDELRQVLGSERISDELLDAFTIFTHSAGPVESLATPAVNRALAWADEHRLGGHRWLNENGKSASAVGSSADTTLWGEVVRVRACVGAQGVGRCRLVVVRLTGNVFKPLQVFAWQALTGPAEIEIDRGS